MKKVTIYVGPQCNFCDAAKRLLQRNNIEYDIIDISSNENIKNEMITKANGSRTIPQIFFGNQHIGGYTELRDLEKNNSLKNKLK